MASKPASLPPWMCGYHLERISVRDNGKEEELVITLHPENKVSRYTYEVHGIRHLERGLTSGLVQECRVRCCWQTMSCPMMFHPTPAVWRRGKDGQDQGRLLHLRLSPEGTEPHVFKLYIKSRTGKLHVLETDVTQQVRSFPVEGHIGNVHLVLNFVRTFRRIPEAARTMAGFDVGADDWADVNTDILC